jgi:hypothetical protein
LNCILNFPDSASPAVLSAPKVIENTSREPLLPEDIEDKAAPAREIIHSSNEPESAQMEWQ